MSESPQFHEDQVIRDLIRTKARRLVRRSDFRGHQVEDLEQELHLQLIRGREKFDPKRGSDRAFATTVVERYAASLVRRQSAEKRNPTRETSLHKAVNSDGAPTELGDMLPESRRTERLGREDRPETDASALRQDVEEILRHVPEDLRSLAEQLMTQTPAAVARERNVPRSTLYGDIRRLRRRFERSDLEKYL